jgi:hypothetical protein
MLPQPSIPYAFLTLRLCAFRRSSSAEQRPTVYQTKLTTDYHQKGRLLLSMKCLGQDGVKSIIALPANCTASSSMLLWQYSSNEIANVPAGNNRKYSVSCKSPLHVSILLTTCISMYTSPRTCLLYRSTRSARFTKRCM